MVSRTYQHVISRFQEEWTRRGEPQLDTYLPPQGEGRLTVLRELICIDILERLRRGEQPRVEGYLHQFPELTHHRELVLTLIQSEWELRSSIEAEPSPQEYSSRFPDKWPELVKRWPNTLCAPELPQAVPVETLGKYELFERIGSGSFADVYRGRDPFLRRIVALKRLRFTAADQSMIERFGIEAQACARLSHPNIVTVYEGGELEGVFYLVLEHVAGGTLADYLQNRLLEPRQAAWVIRQIAQAVHCAHEQGVIHRDLKPGNILLELQSSPVSGAPDGINFQPKVADFGLAKFLDHDQGLTATGAVVGTPSYMAPEQIGEASKVCQATDVYALGAILYHVLVGRPPFVAESVRETLHKVQTGNPIRPQQLRPEVPRDLEVICLKALQKDIGQRYQTAQELVEELDRFLQEQAPRTDLNGSTQLEAGVSVVSLNAGTLPMGMPEPQRQSRRWIWLMLPLMLGLLMGAYALWPFGKVAPKAKVTAFAVQHFSRTGGRKGTVGIDTLKVVQSDRLRIRADLSAEAHWYVITLNPNGSVEIDPAGENQSPTKEREVIFPTGEGGITSINKGTGVQGLILVVSKDPLSQQKLLTVVQPLWRSGGRLEPLSCWTYGNRVLDPMSVNLAVERFEVKGTQPFLNVCQTLEKQAEIADLRGILFPVVRD